MRRCVTAEGMEVPLPVPIEEWIECPLDYSFGIATQNELGEGVLGLARPTEGEILVSEALLNQEGRYRFTCAHELAHLILHRDLAVSFVDGQLPAADDAAKVEREADRFASAMLMPVSTLPRAFEQVRRELGLDPDAMKLLQGRDILADWLWREHFIPALAGRYGVSRAAMVYRCRELRLPRGRRLLRPSLVPLLLAPARVIAEIELAECRIVDGWPMVMPPS